MKVIILIIISVTIIIIMTVIIILIQCLCCWRHSKANARVYYVNVEHYIVTAKLLIMPVNFDSRSACHQPVPTIPHPHMVVRQPKG